MGAALAIEEEERQGEGRSERQRSLGPLPGTAHLPCRTRTRGSFVQPDNYIRIEHRL